MACSGWITSVGSAAAEWRQATRLPDTSYSRYSFLIVVSHQVVWGGGFFARHFEVQAQPRQFVDVVCDVYVKFTTAHGVSYACMLYINSGSMPPTCQIEKASPYIAGTDRVMRTLPSYKHDNCTSRLSNKFKCLFLKKYSGAYFSTAPSAV
jgi:hypothetical protein